MVRRDLSPRLREESDLALAMRGYLRLAMEELSTSAKVKRRLAQALEAIGQISVEVAGSVKVSVGRGARGSSPGRSAAADHAGHVWLAAAGWESASGSQPLGAAVQGGGDRQPAGHSEEAGQPGEAVLALTRPSEGTGISFEPDTAELIARDLDGYPYFIQWYGEQLWDSAKDAGLEIIDRSLYASRERAIQRELDREFYEVRYEDLQPGDQMTLRVAGSLGREEFRVADLKSEITRRKANATAQSLNRLTESNVIYRKAYGLYGYSAPFYGSFLRRAHPRQDDDR